MKNVFRSILLVLICIALGGCSAMQQSSSDSSNSMIHDTSMYTVHSRISDVINDPVFGDYGRLIFPVDQGYMSGDTLGSMRLAWYLSLIHI